MPRPVAPQVTSRQSVKLTVNQWGEPVQGALGGPLPHCFNMAVMSPGAGMQQAKGYSLARKPPSAEPPARVRGRLLLGEGVEKYPGVLIGIKRHAAQ